MERYFDWQVKVGATRHLGGLKATEELVKSCNISKNKRVLEIGCGVGLTLCYVSRKYDCRIVGIDILENMIKEALRKVKKYNIDRKVDLVMADAQNLPFREESFDIVFGESVNVFIEDKLKAMKEYARVVKQGGYIGFNEGTWIKLPPENVRKYLFKLSSMVLETYDKWIKLLMDSGLKVIFTRVYRIKYSDELTSIKIYGIRDSLKVILKFMFLLMKSHETRAFIMRMWKFQLKNLSKYLGYGIYVGKKL